MSVEKRLSEVFQKSQTLLFDETSKFIFFSDCHRGDNSWADDFAHNEKLFFHALNYYFDQGFTYVELGDGDELWENKNFSEIREAHSHVFWLLHKFYDAKRFYLLFGN
ncbi:MAG: serine/threonine protein phosphatase, partial [Candidatus Thermoplasmatota archaeon]|nr:serine/threonine protein phosphatase [Candidatus Thermoplasmatota archaeon]